jgi:hypothetical protein
MSTAWKQERESMHHTANNFAYVSLLSTSKNYASKYLKLVNNGKVAHARYWYRTVAIEVYWSFEHVVFM